MPFTIRKCWRPTNDVIAKIRLPNINYEVGTRSVVFSIGTLFLLGLANRNRKYNGTRSVPTTLGFLPRVFPPRLRSSPENRDRKYNGTRSVPTTGDREALFSQTSFIELFQLPKVILGSLLQLSQNTSHCPKSFFFFKKGAVG